MIEVLLRSVMRLIGVVGSREAVDRLYGFGVFVLMDLVDLDRLCWVLVYRRDIMDCNYGIFYVFGLDLSFWGICR